MIISELYEQFERDKRLSFMTITGRTVGRTGWRWNQRFAIRLGRKITKKKKKLMNRARSLAKKNKLLFRFKSHSPGGHGVDWTGRVITGWLRNNGHLFSPTEIENNGYLHSSRYTSCRRDYHHLHFKRHVATVVPHRISSPDDNTKGSLG